VATSIALAGDAIPDLAVGLAYMDSPNCTSCGSIMFLFLNRDGTVRSIQEVSDGYGNLPTGTLPDRGTFGSCIALVGGRFQEPFPTLVVGSQGINSNSGSVVLVPVSVSGWSLTTGSVTTTTGASTSVVSTTAGVVVPTTGVVVPPASSSGTSGANTTIPIIAGVAVGVCLLICAVAAIFVFIKRRTAESATEPTMVPLETVSTPGDASYETLGMPDSRDTLPETGGYSPLRSPAATLTGTSGYSPMRSPDASPGADYVQHSAIKSDLRLDDRFLIDFSDLRIREELAAGNFGVVSRGEFLGNDCVIKQLKSHAAEAREELLREAQMLSKLRTHASLCTFYGACVDPAKPLCLVTEYIEGGNLGRLLLSPESLVTGRDIVSLARDTAAGMDVLHRSNILHLE
jgi:Protein tyrosine and serine/threonine kinase